MTLRNFNITFKGKYHWNWLPNVESFLQKQGFAGTSKKKSKQSMKMIDVIDLFEQACIRHQQGYHHDALNLYTDLINQLQSQDDSDILWANALTNRGNLHKNLQQCHAALSDYQEAAQLYQQLGANQADLPWASEIANLVKILNSLGSQFIYLQDWESARLCYDRAYSLHQLLGAGHDALWWIGNEGMLLTNRGHVCQNLQLWQEAKGYFDASYNLFHQLDADYDLLKLDSSYQSNSQWFSHEMVKVLSCRSKLLLERHLWQAAQHDLDEAYDLLHQLIVNRDDTRWICYLSTVTTYRGMVHKNLGQWQSALSDYHEAVCLYEQLGANQVSSELMGDFAKLLVNRSCLHQEMEQWQAAQHDLDEAYGLLHQSSTSQVDSELMRALIMLLTNRSNLHQEMKHWQAAQHDLDEAYVLLHQFGADQVGSKLKAELAYLLLSRSNLHQDVHQHWQAAQHDLDEAYVLLYQLGADQADSPLNKAWRKLFIDRARLGLDQGQYQLALNHSNTVLGLFEQLQFFSSGFVTEFTIFTIGFLQLPNIIPQDYLSRFVQLIYRYQDQEFATNEFRCADWWPWVLHALHHENYHWLLSILAASHARRLRHLLELNLLQTATDSPELQTVLELDKQQQLLKLELERLQANSANQSNNDIWVENYQQYLQQYQATQQAFQEAKSQLLGQHDYLDDQIFNITDLQSNLGTDQAVLVCVSLADFGAEHQQTLLLLISQNRIIALDSAKLNAASDAVHSVIYYLIQQASLRSLRVNQRLTPAVADAPIDDNETAYDELKQVMQQQWDVIQGALNNQLIQQVKIVSVGSLTGLPWQGFAPPELSVSQHAGLYALQSRQTEFPYPTSDTPLAIMACDAQHRPDQRLYYLPAEVLLIKAVWGAERIKEIRRLADAPAGSLLLLLGHGNYENGKAYFLTADGDVEQIQFFLHDKPMAMLGASACLLASTLDINAEPLGLMSLAACRSDVKFCFGALVPVDDLLTTCLSLLFHLAWRDSGEPVVAMRLALTQLETGQWPDLAKDLFRQVFVNYLPQMLQTMKEDEVLTPMNRTQAIREDWHDNREFLEDPCYRLAEARSDDVQTDAEVLVNRFLIDINKPEGRFGKPIRQFVKYWLYG